MQTFSPLTPGTCPPGRPSSSARPAAATRLHARPLSSPCTITITLQYTDARRGAFRLSLLYGAMERPATGVCLTGELRSAATRVQPGAQTPAESLRQHVLLRLPRPEVFGVFERAPSPEVLQHVQQTISLLRTEFVDTQAETSSAATFARQCRGRCCPAHAECTGLACTHRRPYLARCALDTHAR